MNDKAKVPPQNSQESHNALSGTIASGSPIQERIQTWREKKAKEETGVRLKPSPDEKDEKRFI